MSEACKLQTDKGLYDITPLQRQISDYFAPSDSDKQFYFNICQATVEPRCNQAAACITSRTNSSDASTWKSLGSVGSAKLSLSEKGKLIYTVSNGDTCPDGSGNMSLRIQFKCLREDHSSDHDNATAIGHPVFVADQNNCEYILNWRSRYGCLISGQSQDIKQPSNGISATGCTYQAPKQSYDLSPLQKKGEGQDWEVHLKEQNGIDDVYLINVCSPLPSSNLNQCPKGTAICAINHGNTSEPARKLGGADGANLSIRDSILTLTYNDSDTCPDNAPRTTEIRFPCRWGELGTPRVIEGQTACGRTVFEWPSRVGCNNLEAGLGAGMITFWILFSLSLIYCVGMALVNRFRHGYAGMEVIPHIDFVTDKMERVRRIIRRDGGIRL